MKKTDINLIPDIQNSTPDYYCTWQTQLYASCDGKPEGQRAIIDENSLFNNQKPYGWAYFYPDIRKNLYLVMDDSWDVPIRGYFGRPQHGSMVLEPEKFPNFADTDNPQKAFKDLADKIKHSGWKGLGLWVCAQEESEHFKGKSQEEYWTERLKWCENAGISYWKVDWGVHAREPKFREWLTALAHKVAPNVIIESALVPEVIPNSDVFRTYDVPAIMSVPMTLAKLSEMLMFTAENGNSALLNCEDEAYIGAALGLCVGIMRHPYKGAFTNGKPDMSFPEVHRNLKTKIDEVTRAVNWHKIAPAFSVDKELTFISKTILSDNWTIENMEAELESWWPQALGMDDNIKSIEKSAPSAISRNMPLPKICAKGTDIPYVVCSKNPNGAVSIATLGRTDKREWFTPRADIEIEGFVSDTFGIFGEYNSLAIKSSLNLQKYKFMAQDLAGTFAYDITEDVILTENSFILSGKLIEKIGNCARKEGDTSEAGLVLKLVQGENHE